MNNLSETARRLVLTTGVSAEAASQLEEDLARVALALGRSVADVADILISTMCGMELTMERMASDSADIRERTKSEPPPTPPSSSGWQMGGIRAARRNRLRRAH